MESAKLTNHKIYKNMFRHLKAQPTVRKLKTKAFTLIELLVVILLIGILSGVIISVINVKGLRSKSRDSQRMADLAKIQTALELYFNDNRAYPLSATNVWATVATSLTTALQTGGYINNIPTDPTRTGTAFNPCAATTNLDYWYRGNATGSRYILAANTEVASSATTSACSNLRNWSPTGPNMGCGTAANCYGVENPF
jgi:prepilin-type N-terminal cleavage/methylation domain-containing protein